FRTTRFSHAHGMPRAARKAPDQRQTIGRGRGGESLPAFLVSRELQLWKSKARQPPNRRRLQLSGAAPRCSFEQNELHSSLVAGSFIEGKSLLWCPVVMCFRARLPIVFQSFNGGGPSRLSLPQMVSSKPPSFVIEFKTVFGNSPPP